MYDIYNNLYIYTIYVCMCFSVSASVFVFFHFLFINMEHGTWIMDYGLPDYLLPTILTLLLLWNNDEKKMVRIIV